MEEFPTSQVSWSPVATKLAYSIVGPQQCGLTASPLSIGQARNVGVYDFETQTPRTIVGPSLDLGENQYESVSVVSWTADGKSVLVSRAFLCDVRALPCDATFELLVASADGGSTQVIQAGEYLWLGNAITAGSLSPDMTHVAFDNGDGVEVAQLDGSNRQRLGHNPCPGSISWSSDADQLVFLDCQAVGEAASGAGLVNTPIVVVDPDGSNKRNIAVTPMAVESSWTIATPPTFTPDGSKVYWSDADGTWTVNLDGTELTKLKLPANIAMTWVSSEN